MAIVKAYKPLKNENRISRNLPQFSLESFGIPLQYTLYNLETAITTAYNYLKIK